VDSPKPVIKEFLLALQKNMEKPDIKLVNDKERHVFSFSSLDGRHSDHFIGN
jgi:hypothetical protein